MPGSIIIISNPRQQVKIQDPRYNIYQIQDKQYLVQHIDVRDSMCLVRGTRLQGTTVVPGAGTSSLRTN